MPPPLLSFVNYRYLVYVIVQNTDISLSLSLSLSLAVNAAALAAIIDSCARLR